MGTGALPTNGTLLKVGDGADPEQFTTIAEVQEINGVKLESAEEDATNFDSGGWEEVIMAVQKVGDISLKLNFIPDGATHGNAAGGLVHSWRTKALKNYQLTFPNTAATVWTIPAYVKSIDLKLPSKGKLEGTAVLRNSGAPTLA